MRTPNGSPIIYGKEHFLNDDFVHADATDAVKAAEYVKKEACVFSRNRLRTWCRYTNGRPLRQYEAKNRPQFNP